MSDFEHLMERVLYGSTQRKQSQKLQKIAKKITKVPKSINIPVEYMVDGNDWSGKK